LYNYTAFTLLFFKNKEKIIIICTQQISGNTEEVLASDCWLSASLDGVQHVLQMDGLSVSDFELAKALLAWGKFQVQNIEVGREDLQKALGPSSDLFKKFDLTPRNFAQLCQMGLDQVLSDKEKYEIFMQLSLNLEIPSPTQLADQNIDPLCGKNCKTRCNSIFH